MILTKTLKIPEKDQSSLLTFFNYDNLLRNEIVKYLNNDSIIGHTHETLNDELLKIFPLEKGSYTHLLSVFFNIARTKSEYKIEDKIFEKEISSFLEKEGIKITKDTKKQILGILNSKLLITAKAMNLASADTTILLKSQIITDLRPVFDFEEKMSLLGNLIVMSLNIEYQDSNEETNNIQFTLDENDLDDLKKQILRAEEKIKIIKASNVNIIQIK